MKPNNPRQLIERCIRECAAARDNRGRWRQARKLSAQLVEAGTQPRIADQTALAALAVGAAIAGFKTCTQPASDRKAAP